MSAIKVLDKEFNTYIGKEDLQQRIKELAAQLNADYRDRPVLFIAVLNGSFMFASDIFKHLTIDCEISFIKIASYKGLESTGETLTLIGLDKDLHQKDVVILEDIVDTGTTMFNFLPRLKHQQPKSLKIVTLLHKPEATKHPLQIDYVGFSIPNKFVVGYGLDYDGYGRNYPDIYQLSE